VNARRDVGGNARANTVNEEQMILERRLGAAAGAAEVALERRPAAKAD
jgi:hypothetical protein